jgi:hypothetical protein
MTSLLRSVNDVQSPPLTNSPAANPITKNIAGGSQRTHCEAGCSAESTRAPACAGLSFIMIHALTIIFPQGQRSGIRLTR